MTGKEALEELVAGLDGVAPFEERDMMRYEHGGGRLAIIRDGQRNLVADLYHEADREHFLRCSPDRIRAIATDFAALEETRDRALVALAEMTQAYREAEARAIAAETKAAEMEEAKNAILQVIKHHSGSDHGVMGVRLLVERAVAADEKATKLKMNLEGRDKFIVDHGLWVRFVKSLKQTKPNAALAGDKP